jgi:hypothetical protein
MNKFFWIAFISISIAACKNPKADLNSNEKITAENFIAAFKPIKLPATIADTALQRFGDTIVISNTVLTQFIPDSVLQQFADNKNDVWTIHAAGIIHKKERDFLLAKFISKKKITLGVFVLDDKHAFLTSFQLVDNLKKDNYTYSVSITEEPTFIRKREKLANNNTLLYTRNGFAYNSTAHAFAEVLQDSNEDTDENDTVINPIDTFPSTQKYSGDYVADKKNFISVRDGKNAETYSFFIHFEQKKGDCIGELKGMMTLTNEKNAVFTQSGDPCIIDFKFNSSSVKIKEQGNCGNHRGITCPFDFTFKRKTEQKKKTK